MQAAVDLAGKSRPSSNTTCHIQAVLFGWTEHDRNQVGHHTACLKPGCCNASRCFGCVVWCCQSGKKITTAEQMTTCKGTSRGSVTIAWSVGSHLGCRKVSVRLLAFLKGLLKGRRHRIVIQHKGQAVLRAIGCLPCYPLHWPCQTCCEQNTSRNSSMEAAQLM